MILVTIMFLLHVRNKNATKGQIAAGQIGGWVNAAFNNIFSNRKKLVVELSQLPVT